MLFLANLFLFVQKLDACFVEHRYEYLKVVQVAIDRFKGFF